MGLIQKRSMWLVERFEGIEGFFKTKITYTGLNALRLYGISVHCIYFSNYLPQVVGDINVHVIWDVNSSKKFEWEALLGKHRWIKVKGNSFYRIYSNILFETWLVH